MMTASEFFAVYDGLAELGMIDIGTGESEHEYALFAHWHRKGRPKDIEGFILRFRETIHNLHYELLGKLLTFHEDRGDDYRERAAELVVTAFRLFGVYEPAYGFLFVDRRDDDEDNDPESYPGEMVSFSTELAKAS